MAGVASTGPAPEGGGALGSLDRLVWRVEQAFALTAAYCILALMLIAVVQIVGRTLFNRPIFGYIDMVEIAMTTFAFLAISYAERLGSHIRMEIVVGRFKGRALWLAEIVGVLAAMFVISVLTYYGWEHAMRAYTNGDSTIDAEYSWWPSKMLVPISFALLWLRLLVSLIGYLRLFKTPTAEPVGIFVPESPEAAAEREAREALGEGAGGRPEERR
ncbi:MAG: TRAP transporter small permease [Hyphomicrobiaceae bacterium]|nr:TRAP transporter small permease [Hyphomicrobiaceae bacterium]